MKLLSIFILLGIAVPVFSASQTTNPLHDDGPSDYPWPTEIASNKDSDEPNHATILPALPAIAPVPMPLVVVAGPLAGAAAHVPAAVAAMPPPTWIERFFDRITDNTVLFISAMIV